MQLSGKLSRQYFQNEPITSEIAKRHGLIDRSYYRSKRDSISDDEKIP